MPRSISGQVIAIAGASSGIGLACARDFAACGAAVALGARNSAALDEAVAEIRSSGGRAVAVPCDVGNAEDCVRLAEGAVAAFGRLDTWLHVAGVSCYGAFKDVPIEDIRRVMEVNFMGAVHGAKAALPHLEKTAGALVVVGSALGDRGAPLQSAYCASKHALKGWLDALRVELHQEGSPVRATLVKPSSMDTPFFASAKTYLGAQPRPIPPVYDVSVAVRAIRDAVENTPRDVYAGAAGKMLAIGERAAPGALDALQRFWTRDYQTVSRQKGPEDESNLYAPVAREGRISGDYKSSVRRRNVKWALAGSAAAAAVGLLAVRSRGRS